MPRYRVSVPPPPPGRKRRRWRGWRWWCWRTRREAGRSGMVASARTEASATLQSVGRARQRATPRVFPIAHIFMQKVSTIASLPLLRRLLLQLLSRCIKIASPTAATTCRTRFGLAPAAPIACNTLSVAAPFLFSAPSIDPPAPPLPPPPPSPLSASDMAFPAGSLLVMEGRVGGAGEEEFLTGGDCPAASAAAFSGR